MTELLQDSQAALKHNSLPFWCDLRSSAMTRYCQNIAELDCKYAQRIGLLLNQKREIQQILQQNYNVELNYINQNITRISKLTEDNQNTSKISKNDQINQKQTAKKRSSNGNNSHSNSNDNDSDIDIEKKYESCDDTEPKTTDTCVITQTNEMNANINIQNIEDIQCNEDPIIDNNNAIDLTNSQSTATVVNVIDISSIDSNNIDNIDTGKTGKNRDNSENIDNIDNSNDDVMDDSIESDNSEDYDNIATETETESSSGDTETDIESCDDTNIEQNESESNNSVTIITSNCNSTQNMVASGQQTFRKRKKTMQYDQSATAKKWKKYKKIE